MPPKKPAGPTPVEALTHDDSRVNIPTEELRDFVADDEKAPRTMRYPRDPSLDPQLVWKGKDEQDTSDLEVPVVPIYIQEKIQPRAIIEELRAQSERAAPEPQLSMFKDSFNGLEFDQLVEFYQHEQHWSNRLILGDSLQVMTSLAEKEGLKGKVQMIYIDPPYGIDFRSNWQVRTDNRHLADGRPADLTRQPEQVKAFRDTWRLGVHSYLSYLRDRLQVSRELLSHSGSVFVQIGDQNIHLVRSLLDEVFGFDNFGALIPFRTAISEPSVVGTPVCNFLLWYCRDRDQVKARKLYRDKSPGEEGATVYNFVDLPDGTRRRASADEIANAASQTSLRFFSTGGLDNNGKTESGSFEVEFEGRTFREGPGKHWQTTRDGIDRLALARRLAISGSTLRYVRFIDDYPVAPIVDLWNDTITGSFTDPKLYAVQTNTKVVQRCILMTTDPGDLVLDPTCGSGTTSYVAEQWGRRWITIDTSRVALALARTRMMAARYPYYLPADSAGGAKKEAELTGVTVASTGKGDIRKGFVYRRVPHVTLKSIANNEEIDRIHEHWQGDLEPVREKINALTGETHEEWELPREPAAGWPAEAGALLAEWWELRRKRQREIDDSIAKRADQELLYDQPYEDPKRIRVAGPFTVESLSPHRMLSTDDERPEAEQEAKRDPAGGQYELTIIENLRKAGVQNTFKDQRIKFDRLDTYAGEWIQAAGEYTDADGSPVRVAVSIGPEHGTVGPEQVKEAAKEAMKGFGFSLLLVCGFAFDAHASQTAKEVADEAGKAQVGDGTFFAESQRKYGALTVLLTRMNPDLAMGDLLKKTGAGNLFTVFGEPDIVITPLEDGTLTVEIRGVDIYDPTTGTIRSNATNEIACWFLDTDYNSESFFVRHAYFSGADDPYERLRKTLRAEIDEEAWATLYSTKSFPFPRPSTGKIAVKVINHYGDEVLKVYGV